MKAVLISIQPRHCENIASGKKTVEIRRTRPKCNVLFRCYIYCTKPRKFIHGYPDDELFRHIDGRIECGFSFQITTEKGVFTKDNFLSGKVIGEFVCDKIGQIRFDDDGDLLYEPSLAGCSPCLSLGELQSYIGVNNVGYGWHILDLKIYDKPRELGEFRKPCASCGLAYSKYLARYMGCWDNCRKHITRPPQSWCYVEEAWEV